MPIPVCVLRNGRLEPVYVQINTATGDTTYQGRPFAAAFGADSTYAVDAAWYTSGQPIVVLKSAYVKYGLPRILAPTDVVPVAAFRGVTVFAEPAANPRRPEVVYLPVRPGCEFQTYVPLAKL